MALWLSLCFNCVAHPLAVHMSKLVGIRKTKANSCLGHWRSLRHAHPISCTSKLVHQSTKILPLFRSTFVSASSLQYLMRCSTMTMHCCLLLFPLCSWAELNSHTQIVKHCIKNTCWVGSTRGHMDSSCIICILILKRRQAITIPIMNSELT